MFNSNRLRKALLLIFAMLPFVTYAQYAHYSDESNENYSLGVKAYKKKQYGEAKNYFEKCYELDVATLGKEDDRIYHSIMWYGRCLYMMGEKEEALKYSRWCSVEPVDREKTIVSDSLSHIADEYAKSGNIQKALETALVYSKIEQKNVGENYWYANTLTTIAGYYIQLQDKESSLKYNLQALTLRKKLFGETHVDCCNSSNNIGDILSMEGNYPEATKYYVDALKNYLLLFSEDDNANTLCNKIYNSMLNAGTDLVSSKKVDNYVRTNLKPEIVFYLFNNLKMTYFRQFQYLDAELYARNILDLYKNSNDENELNALTEYGNILKFSGQYTEALNVFKQIEKQYKDKCPNDMLYAMSSREYCEVQHTLGNRTDAYKKGLETVRLFKDIYDVGKDNSSITELSWMLTLQARYCNILGKFDEALSNVDEGISILKNNADSVPDWNSRVARSLITKAKIVCDSGNHDDAYNIINECISTIKQDSLCTIFDYANALDVSTDILCKKGMIPEAVAACDEFISILEKTSGIDNDRYLNAIEKKAAIFTLVGDYANAVALHEQAGKLASKLYGSKSMNYVLVQNNAATCKYSLGDVVGALDISNKLCQNLDLADSGNEYYLYQVMFQKAIYEMFLDMAELAIEDFKFALDVYKVIERQANKTPDIYATKATIYSNLALAYNLAKKKKEAVDAIQKAKEILEKNNLDDTISYAEMAVMNSYISDASEDNISPLLKAEKIVTELLGNNNVVYENILSALANQFMYLENVDSIETYATRYMDVAIKTLENNRLNLTNAARNNFWEKHDFVFNNDIPHLAAKYNTSKLCVLAYNSALYHKGFMLNSNNLVRNTILQSNDPELIEHYMRYQNAQQMLTNEMANKVSDNYDNLKEILQREERFILNKFSTLNDVLTKTYKWEDVQKALHKDEVAVEVLSYAQEDDNIKNVAVCVDSECQFPFLIELYEDSYIDSLINNEGLISGNSLQALASPFNEIAKKYKTVYFSPTGKLHTIPLENIIDGCVFYRVSSTSQICDSHVTNLNTASLYGGLDYNASLAGKTTKRDKKHSDLAYIYEDIERDLREGAEYLPGTLTEVHEIRKIMESNNVAVMEYTESFGTENKFKEMSGDSPNIIHLATHGKYVPIKDVKEIKESKNLNFLITNVDTSVLPFDDLILSHSYLVFSGGNALFKHEDIADGEENGILTALEISQLDFRNTDLVVMSACQSGLGDSGDEGVIGLQYGFKKAGVKSLLVSLDNVDDRATEILMVAFYQNLLSGKSKSESLKLAQETVKKTDGGKYSAPKYWASFVLIDALD